MKTACFTGSRPNKLWGYNKDPYVPFVNKLVDIIYKLYEAGYDTFITGGAQGLDQCAFWAVNIAKSQGLLIKNIVYVPFKGQENRWKATGLFSKQEYQTMLRHADEVRYLTEIDGSNYSQVVKALYARNHSMCDDSDLVVGLYPNTEFRTDRHSGTAECLRYAENIHKPIWLINKDTFGITILKNKKG